MMQKVLDYIVDSFHEMRDKVTWPKYSELQQNSILVLVASLIISLTIWGMDVVFQSGMEWIYNLNF